MTSEEPSPVMPSCWEEIETEECIHTCWGRPSHSTHNRRSSLVDRVIGNCFCQGHSLPRCASLAREGATQSSGIRFFVLPSRARSSNRAGWRIPPLAVIPALTGALERRTRCTMTVLGESQVTYSYNNSGQLTSLTQGSTVVSLDYFPDGRVQTRTLKPSEFRPLYTGWTGRSE